MATSGTVEQENNDGNVLYSTIVHYIIKSHYNVIINGGKGSSIIITL